LRRERESCGFDVYEGPTDSARTRVKVRRLDTLQIGKKASDPRRKMLLEGCAIHFRWGCNTAANKASHELAEERGMILRLRSPLRLLDAEVPEGFAQPR
jgi:hypothetical protein